MTGFVLGQGAPPAKVDDLYRKELLTIIQWAIDVHPRSHQHMVGPSEIGGCPTKLAWKLAYGGAGTQQGGWSAHKGTVLHAWLDEVYDGHVIGDKLPTMPDGSPRFFSDLKLDQIHPLISGGTLDLYDKLREVIVDWKALKLSTLVPTPTGWSTVGEIRVGEKLFGGDGKPCTVLGKTDVFTAGQTFKVTFDDGAEIVCDGGHLWDVETGKRRGHYLHRTVTTSWMADRLQNLKGRRDIRVRMHGALDLPEAELPIDPYLFGVWLGDGFSNEGRICQGAQDAEELFGYLADDGHQPGEAPVREDGFQRRRIVGLTSALSGMGLIRKGRGTGKRIPPEYLRASFDQRLALLRGLMDTDGCYDRRGNRAVFTQKDRSLAEQVAELVRSLGLKANVWEGRSSGFGIVSTQCKVHFTPDGVNPFRLKRKADLVRITGSRESWRRIVHSVEPVESEPVQCITVDSPDSTFLVGEQMIKTHNCPGEWTMKNVRSNHLSEGYYVQAQQYARTLMETTGHKVSRIALMFLPMAGDDLHGAARGAVFRYWDYDPDVSEQAMGNVSRIKNMIDAAGPTKAMEILPKRDDFCQSCPAFVGSGDRRAVCPGAVNKSSKSANPFAK